MNAETMFFKLNSASRCHSLLALKTQTHSHRWPTLKFSTGFCSPECASFVPESLQAPELSFWSDFAFSLWDGTENSEKKRVDPVLQLQKQWINIKNSRCCSFMRRKTCMPSRRHRYYGNNGRKN